MAVLGLSPQTFRARLISSRSSLFRGRYAIIKSQNGSPGLSCWHSNRVLPIGTRADGHSVPSHEAMRALLGKRDHDFRVEHQRAHLQDSRIALPLPCGRQCSRREKNALIKLVIVADTCYAKERCTACTIPPPRKPLWWSCAMPHSPKTILSKLKAHVCGLGTPKQ